MSEPTLTAASRVPTFSGAHPPAMTVAPGEWFIIETADRFRGLYEGEPRDRAASQVIPVAEPARHDHAIHAGEGGILMPDVTGGFPEDIGQGMMAVLVAVAAGKLEDAESHWISNEYSSITGLLNSL